MVFGKLPKTPATPEGQGWLN